MPNRFTIKITKTGKSATQFLKEVNDKIHFELQNEIKLSADATVEIMRRIIKGSGYKLDRLANAINSEIISSTGGISIGIGKISDLPKNDKGEDYWQAFNDGFKPGASGTIVPLGSFAGEAPDSNKVGGKWTVGNGNYTFLDNNKNKKLVPPLMFVDIGYEDLKEHINKEIDKFMRGI